MSDTLPDRLSTNPDSPHYDADLLERGVGVRFKGEDKTNVDEYCVSEGWVKLAVGKTLDRRGKSIQCWLKVLPLRSAKGDTYGAILLMADRAASGELVPTV